MDNAVIPVTINLGDVEVDGLAYAMEKAITQMNDGLWNLRQNRKIEAKLPKKVRFTGTLYFNAVVAEIDESIESTAERSVVSTQVNGAGTTTTTQASPSKTRTSTTVDGGQTSSSHQSETASESGSVSSSQFVSQFRSGTDTTDTERSYETYDYTP